MSQSHIQDQSLEKTDLLRLTARQIADLASSTEGEFLEVGEKLQELFQRSLSMAEAGQSAAELMSGAAVNQVIGQLRDLVAQMKEYLQSTRNRMDQSLLILQEVGNSLDRSRRIFNGFIRIIKSLNILGTLTKIESAHMGRHGQGFLFLSEEVTNQSRIIEAQSSDVLNKLDELSGQVRSILTRLNGFRDNQRGWGEAVIGQVVTSLEGLIETQKTSSRTAGRVKARSEQISRNMVEVVSSMQFHDITRQRLEHVQAALERVLDQEVDEQVPGVCRLQVSQLQQARTDIVGAVESIISNLTGVAENVQDISREVLSLVGSTGQEDDSFLTRLEQDVTSVAAFLGQHQAMSQNMTGAISSVTETLAVMTDFLKQIQGIGYSIRFIALNATIKAARLGRKGVTLDVLAQEIRQVSQEAQEHMGNLAGIHKLISSSTGRLRNFCQMESGVEEMVEHLGGLLDSVCRTNEQCLTLLTNMDQEGQRQVEEIRALVSGITVHQRMDGGLRQVEAFLNNIAGQVDGPAARLSQEELLTDLADHYTMESERQVHLSITTGKAVSGDGNPAEIQREEVFEDNFELFSDAPGAAEAEDGGDDNIELFGPPLEAENAGEEAGLGDGVELFDEPKTEDKADYDQDLGDNVELF